MMPPPLTQTARLLLAIGKPNTAALVEWLNANRKPNEQIEVYQWMDALWYVVVVDESLRNLPPGEYPRRMLVGFTIDIQKDVIFWCCGNPAVFASELHGGNCFCRSERWWKLVRQRFPHIQSQYDTREGPHIHDYRVCHHRRRHA